MLVLTYPGHFGLPNRKAVQKKMLSYIPGKAHLLTPRTEDELWEGGEKITKSGQLGKLYIRPRYEDF